MRRALLLAFVVTMLVARAIPGHAGSHYTNTASSTILNTYTSNVAYDDIGNITRNQQTATLQMDSGPPIPDPNLTRDWSYSYDHTGDPTAPPHAPSHVGDRHYTWDRNGNQLGFTPTDGAVTRTIQWDDENRVSSIVDTSPGVPDQSTHFLSNANGERTHKISSVDSLVTVYPNQWVTARLGDPGMDGTRPIAVMTNHIYAGAQRLASRMTPAGETAQRFWYHGDHLSSSNYVTDDAATIDEHVEYFPYGETWIDEQMPREGGGGEGSPERYLYTGKELDTETGLYYFGARYYDPQTAQWASADPILGEYLRTSRNGGVFNPINLGLYTYSYNSPIRLRDPDGMQTMDIDAGFARPPSASQEHRDASPAVGAGGSNGYSGTEPTGGPPSAAGDYARAAVATVATSALLGACPACRVLAGGYTVISAASSGDPVGVVLGLLLMTSGTSAPENPTYTAETAPAAANGATLSAGQQLGPMGRLATRIIDSVGGISRQRATVAAGEVRLADGSIEIRAAMSGGRTIPASALPDGVRAIPGVPGMDAEEVLGHSLDPPRGSS